MQDLNSRHYLSGRELQKGTAHGYDLSTTRPNGLKLSPIGLGTVKMGRNTNVKYPTALVTERPRDHSTPHTCLRAGHQLP